MHWLLLLIVGAILLSGRSALAYVAGKPATIELGSLGNGFVLRKDAAAAFLRMREAASNDGIILNVERAFATMEQQTELWERYRSGAGNLAAKPGYSEHQGGTAVDVSVGRSFTSSVYVWLEANARDFGFSNTGKYFDQPEPHHWSFRA